MRASAPTGFQHPRKGRHTGRPLRTDKGPSHPRRDAPTTARGARSEAERAEREAGQMRPCTPTIWAPSATGRQHRPRRRPKRARRPAQIGAGTDTPTPVQQLCTYVQSCDQKRSFLLDRARPVFFSTRWKRKWGVHPCWTSPPAGADPLPAAVRRPLPTQQRVHLSSHPNDRISPAADSRPISQKRKDHAPCRTSSNSWQLN